MIEVTIIDIRYQNTGEQIIRYVADISPKVILEHTQVLVQNILYALKEYYQDNTVHDIIDINAKADTLNVFIVEALFEEPVGVKYTYEINVRTESIKFFGSVPQVTPASIPFTGTGSISPYSGSQNV